MSRNVQDKRSKIFDFICHQHRKTGIYPSIREICKHMGFASTNTAAYHLRQLEQDGLLERSEHQARSFSVPRDVLAKSGGIPVVGRVAAGTPILAEQNYDGQLTVAELFPVRDGRVFALRVKGDSMIDAGIFDGDMVVVQSETDVARGEIAVVIVENETTVKRIYDDGTTWRLQPENAAMEPIVVEKGQKNFSIAGKVIGVIRCL